MSFALEAPRVLESTRDRYLRSPRFSIDGSGRPWLYLVVWTREGERVERAEVTADGQVGVFAGVSPGRDPVAVALLDPDPSAEERGEAAGFRVRIERVGGRSRVAVTTPARREVTVWEAWGTAAAPTLAGTEGGAFVAFHHNVREDSGEVDLAKWIAVRLVTAAGDVLEPAAPMCERDRDRAGEEQSFEFPCLVPGPDGALTLLGRGSHGHFRQDLTREGWSHRLPFDDGAWGCRGRRVAALRLSETRVLLARRARRGIELREMCPAPGEAPALVPAVVRVGAPPPATPVEPAERPPTFDGRRTLFGDVHQHSAHSDGLGVADEPYVRARHVYGDDFCALTDHESFLGKRLGPAEWAYLTAVADRHDAPGRFATLLAYEWTARAHPGPGHKVVYLPPGGGPVLSRDALPEGRDLVAAVRAIGGLAVPHHVGWTGANEDAHAPDVQPVWEICSCHGCYEHWAHALGQRGDLRAAMVDAVLRRGHRFGFIASSDGHGLLWHHGVARKRDPFRTGLAAVEAAECTRAGVFGALRDRRCYATSGAKILLDVRAGDQPMGAELASAEEVELVVRVRGTARLSRVEVVGRDGVRATAAGTGEVATLRTRLRDAYAYVRAVQEDGEMAWSSPVFWP